MKFWYLTKISKFENKNKNVISLSNRQNKGKYIYSANVPKNDICPPPVQTKHNLYIQVQKKTKSTLVHVTSNEQKYKRFKFTSLGGSY